MCKHTCVRTRTRPSDWGVAPVPVVADSVARVRIAGGSKCASAPRVVCTLQYGHETAGPVSPGCPRLGGSLPTERAGVRPSPKGAKTRARASCTSLSTSLVLLLYFSSEETNGLPTPL